MNNAVTPNRWFQGWRAARRPVPLDPADLGTAFGLDASFGESQLPPQGAPTQVKAGWMKRLSSRSKRPA